MKLRFTPRLLLIGCLGFFSGLPLALTASTLTAWLADSGVERAAIGLFAAIATPYALKFLWSPLVDGLRLPILGPWLGRRRSWLFATQLLLVLGILGMGTTNPALIPWVTGLMGLVVATLSATQDIVIDAYRVELLPPEDQGTGAAMAMFGYRIGMLVSGAGALAAADALGWQGSYGLMAVVMALGVLLTLLAPRPAVEATLAVPEPFGPSAANRATARAAAKLDPLLTFHFEDEAPAPTRETQVQGFWRAFVLAPLKDFTTRPHWLAVLVFVVLYKLGDAFMGVMFNPFLLDLGFTKTEIAAVVKLYGLGATLLGAFAGGWAVARFGLFRTLMVCGVLHMLTNLLLVVQARLGADVHFLALSISLENFTGGASTTAFIAYLSALCALHYTATQYALLSSLAAFGRTWLSTPSGWLAARLGWEGFFAIASVMAVPGLVLLVWLERRKTVA